ncbi:hypothetical protein J5N97_022532 [Dioscorea zingiberensis]|uniref:Uncharacterized protein n=1 Tax=Dioscorea zingiberensis TaxID=325984 RepID=A0A9D5CC45_9LILI|nr:hypothetical protein J5N97_022532 [Dioscorea zingiberensis]
MDLHTKRTGHAEFANKTSETAKPIDLEKPAKADGGPEESAAGAESSQSEVMVVPKVDQKMLEELESMSFPIARATRALHYSGCYNGSARWRSLYTHS